MRLAVPLIASTLAAVSLIAAWRGRSEATDTPSAPPAGTLLDLGTVQREFGRRTRGYLTTSLRSDLERTEAPAEIDWAAGIDAAIARARAENKPIFVNSHVREYGNVQGDPACDV